MEFLVLIFLIIFIVVATVRFKLHPVIPLIVACIIGGLGFGLNPTEIIAGIRKGFGNTLSNIGLVIAFGTIIGIFLEITGGTKVIALTILKWVGLNRSALALNLAGFVISIPVYCDSGFVILSSLNKALSQKTGLPKLLFAIALATGLYSAHVFVPPTPGPLAAASILEADLGKVLLLGLAVALPVSIVGCLWATRFGNQNEGEKNEQKDIVESDKITPLIKPIHAFLPIVLPIVLIALKSIAEYPSKPFGDGFVFTSISFVGSPIIALLLAVLAVLVMAFKLKEIENKNWVGDAMKQAGAIILITGAGGAFGEIIRTIDFSEHINLNSNSGFGGLLICFAIAALLKTAQGSSTVAIITTAAIVSPLLESFGLLGATEIALAVLAIGAGAMTVSHVNDSYFWVVKEFSGLNLKTALRGYTLATLIQGIVGIGMILILYMLF